MIINNIGLLNNIKHEIVGYFLQKTKVQYWEDCQKYVYKRGIDPEKICEVEETLNIPYINHCEIALAMDMFKPILPEEKELPVIICIHGGGLVVEDRKYFRHYAYILAGRGYLVYSLDYRLAPFFYAAEQMDDICAGMDEVGKQLVNVNADFSRIYLVADSAGAFLAVYTAAMKGSEELQKAIGYKPTRMVFRALGLHSGMIYTLLTDPIGLLLSDQYYGDKSIDQNFLKYMNPEHPEIIKNLPPVFMTTSRGDFLNNYTLMYHQALKNAGKKSHLVYYGQKDLWHAFPTFDSYNKYSLDAIGRMLAWFEEQAVPAQKEEAAQACASPEDITSQADVSPEDITSQADASPEDITLQAEASSEDKNSQADASPEDITPQSDASPEDITPQSDASAEDITN